MSSLLPDSDRSDDYHSRLGVAHPRQRQPLMAYSSNATHAFPDMQTGATPLYQLPPLEFQTADENDKKNQADAKQLRQKKMIVIALLTLIVLFLFNNAWQSGSSLSGAASRPPVRPNPIGMVGYSPIPSATSTSASIIAAAGTRTYTLPSEFTKDEPAMQQPFLVYVPSRLARSDAARFYSTLSTDSDLFHSFPLVVSLHGTASNAAVELESWIEYSERYQWIILCPNLLTTTAIGSTGPTTLELESSVNYLDNVMNSVLGNADEADPKQPSLSLTRLINRQHILLTAHDTGGYTFLSFLLQRPNYWTALAARSIHYQPQHAESILKPLTHQFAVDAWRSGRWRLPISASSDPSEAHVVELFWTEIYMKRPLLCQIGEFDTPRIKEEMDQLHVLLRNQFGFRHLAHEMMPQETHRSRPDITAKWWSKKINNAP